MTDQQLLHADGPALAADHFVGLLLWIPINRVMFRGDSDASSKGELDWYADAAVKAFLRAEGRR